MVTFLVKNKCTFYLLLIHFITDVIINKLTPNTNNIFVLENYSHSSLK